MNDDDDLDWQRLGLAVAACALVAGLMMAVFVVIGPPTDPYMKGETRDANIGSIR